MQNPIAVEYHERGEVRPTLVVGLGGSGVYTARRLKRLIQERYSTEGLIRLSGFDNVKNVQIVGSISGVQSLGAVKEPDEIVSHPFSEPISLFKWAEPREARPGDIVTYYLRYKNNTREPVDNLAITDSLIPRLEYIPGSARSDREMAFSVKENEVGSAVLRWQLTGQLPPGAQGVVSFQVRVR